MKYSDGTVFLQHNRKWPKWYENFMTKWIVRASKSPFIHGQVMLNGVVYESTFPVGVTKGRKPNDLLYYGDKVLTFSRPPEEGHPELTEIEVNKMTEYFEYRIKRKVPYATFKLIFYLMFRWTKPLWDKLNWYPFADDFKYGEFCFAIIENAFKHAGIDIAPGKSEEDSIAPNFIGSKYFK